ncbi:MAG: adenosylcobalamin-dependent ribonucleoside-diphosphate reductase [Dictyoglomi bacterium]|nr:adenosylcobalamin-dependent ribonucleoside-diphosphate reductase [Dictyoglomota bacterium]
MELDRLSQEVWERKYRWEEEKSLDDNISRVAREAAKVEETDEKRREWEEKFYQLMKDTKFLPGGRILAGIGTSMHQTLFNCFTLPVIDDSIEGIFEAVKLNAIIHSLGGGTGVNFSTIRPEGAEVKTKGGIASGPVSFMTVFDAETKTITTGNARKGANMGILNVDHPDIEKFITAKHTPGVLTQFNISVGITDEFISAVINDTDWELKFNGKVYKVVRARDLWDLIVRSAYDYAEPGIINLSTINKLNNLYYIENIQSTNPCGEQPLPPAGCCLLGSFNLTQFVMEPFTENARFNLENLNKYVPVAVRLLDNIIEISEYPFPAYEEEEKTKRRMGIGIMGLGSTLAMLGLKYSSAEGRRQAEVIAKTIRDSAYQTSAILAKEKGPFKYFDRDKYLEGEFIKRLPGEIRELIKENGIHNSHLISIAPTGTLSVVANNISSGIEPIFSLSYKRRVKMSSDSIQGDSFEEYEVMDYAYKLYRELKGDGPIPPYFETAYDIKPEDHLEMLETVSFYVDSSVSKTINVPRDYPIESFFNLFLSAMQGGVKGLTVYREGSREGILIREEEKKPARSGKPERPYKLKGTTYKIKTPRASYYITLNEIEEEKKRRPFEIFINTKDASSIPWITALARLMSAVFVREENPSFLIDQLRSIVDPNGGYWRDGKRIPSVLSDIANVLEEYLTELGKIEKREPQQKLLICPECGQQTYILEEGCGRCLSCGYSECS